MKVVNLSLLALSLLLSGNILGTPSKCDDQEETTTLVEQAGTSTRYPQTIIHDLVFNFLSCEKQSKERKVLLLGYDGYREDALENLSGLSQSAIYSLAREGGLYQSYAGANGEQETSTAPGWLSILSGKWAYLLDVHNNNDQKPADEVTILNDAITLGYASTFIASWAPHFTITYQEDIEQPEGNAVYQQMEDDDETLMTLHQVLADTSSSSYDVIFATLEYTDHAGHTMGYGNQIDEYVDASIQADQAGYALLQTIHSRDSLHNEDWLILITTDHGGKGGSHGGQSTEETNTWFVINKDLDTLFGECE